MFGLESNGCFVTDAPCIIKVMITALLVSSVGQLKSNSVGLLVYDSMHIISGALVLSYRSLGITSTMPRRG
jgi:hypothetical protein